MESIQKIILIATGIVALILKIKNIYSLKNQKQDLKQDIEILDLLKKQNNPNIENIERKIDTNLRKLYDDNTLTDSGISGFILGITFFIGFGWWSVNIFNNSLEFNGWIILTMFLSASGLSMIAMDTTRFRKNEPFYKIGFYEKSNMRIGLILSFIGGFSLWILIVKLQSFSFWEFLSGLVFLYGIFLILKNIKEIK